MIDIDENDNKSKQNKTEKKKKRRLPKILIAFRVVGFLLLIGGITLLIIGICTRSEFMSFTKEHRIFAGIFVIFLSFAFLANGYQDKLQRLSINIDKHVAEYNKEELEDLKETTTGIGIKGTSRAIKNNKSSIYDAVETGAEAVAKAVNNVNEEDATKYKFCSNCGNKITKSANFCSHCGAKQE